MNKLVRFLAFELQIQEETDLEGYMQKPGCPVPRYTATPQPQGAAKSGRRGEQGCWRVLREGLGPWTGLVVLRPIGNPHTGLRHLKAEGTCAHPSYWMELRKGHEALQKWLPGVLSSEPVSLRLCVSLQVQEKHMFLAHPREGQTKTGRGVLNPSSPASESIISAIMQQSHRESMGETT